MSNGRTMTTDELAVFQLGAALAEPFDPGEIKFKPQSVKENRARAVAYIDARVVMDRLDEVLGVDGWQDSYTESAGGGVKCTLCCRFVGNWVPREDVGAESEQPDGDDRRKAAYSDALKRAAVKFGIGRYLYRLPKQWCDYDPQKRLFLREPVLPEWAKPDATVSYAQIHVLRGLIGASGASEPLFLETFGVAAVHKLPTGDYRKACELLRKKLKQQGQELAAQQPAGLATKDQVAAIKTWWKHLQFTPDEVTRWLTSWEVTDAGKLTRADAHEAIQDLVGMGAERDVSAPEAAGKK